VNGYNRLDKEDGRKEERVKGIMREGEKTSNRM
jgi:hypothetical protein